MVVFHQAYSHRESYDLFVISCSEYHTTPHIVLRLNFQYEYHIVSTSHCKHLSDRQSETGDNKH